MIGAVLVPGAKAPKLVSNELVARMKPGLGARRHRDRPGRLLRGLAPDDARRPDLHRVHDSVFYCVANMPGAVPHTSTYALTNVTLPYVCALADKGLRASGCRTTRRWPGASTWSAARSYPLRSPTPTTSSTSP